MKVQVQLVYMLYDCRWCSYSLGSILTISAFVFVFLEMALLPLGIQFQFVTPGITRVVRIKDDLQPWISCNFLTVV